MPESFGPRENVVASNRLAIRRGAAGPGVARAVKALVALMLAALALTSGPLRSATAGEPSYGYRFGVFPYRWRNSRWKWNRLSPATSAISGRDGVRLKWRTMNRWAFSIPSDAPT